MPEWFKSLTSWLFSPLIGLSKWFWRQFKFFVPYLFALVFVASSCFGGYIFVKVLQAGNVNEANAYRNEGAQQALTKICREKTVEISGKTFTCK